MRSYRVLLITLLSIFLSLSVPIVTACSGNSGVEDQKELYKYREIDSLILENKIVQFSGRKELPLNKLVIEIALSLLDTPYVGGTLEGEKELFVINLRETDCILFVEMCTAIALTVKDINLSDKKSDLEEKNNFYRYCANLRSMRYIGGTIGDYSSRNHYTSGWIIQNEEYGVMKEVSSELSSVKLDQKFFFMSENPNSYKQLKNNPDLVQKIRSVEQELNRYEYFHITKSDIESVKESIKDGDIVCFTSKVPGLDISHVGFAYWKDNNLHFIHASSKAMKVIIEEKTLSDYTGYGIRVVRL